MDTPKRGGLDRLVDAIAALKDLDPGGARPFLEEMRDAADEVAATFQHAATVEPAKSYVNACVTISDELNGLLSEPPRPLTARFFVACNDVQHIARLGPGMTVENYRARKPHVAAARKALEDWRAARAAETDDDDGPGDTA